MNREQRVIYLELTNEIGWSICAFCKFAESLGGCGDGMSCEHPLGERGRLPAYDEDLSPGDDCWGFRPSNSVSFIADIVGIMLEHGWTEATWWTDPALFKDDRLRIAGR